MPAAAEHAAAARSSISSRPQDRSDQPEIEIYFEKPPPGRPLQAFAFRATMKVPGGNEYIRFTRDFEAVWRERFGSK